VQRFTLTSLHVLGLLLVLISLIGVGVRMVRYQAVEVSERHELKLEIKGFEIRVETGRMYFGVFVGLILAVAPFPISKYFGAVWEAEKEERAIPSTPKLREGGFTISEQEERIDLQHRKQIGVTDYLGGDLSETTRLIRRVIKDIKGDVKEVNFRHATSGYRIAASSIPPGAKWRIMEEESEEVIYNPFTDLLRGKEFFEDLLARKGKMKSYYMTVPITEGKGQEIAYTLKYYNAYQGSDFEWAGKVFSADTDKLTMHVTFPKDKPLKSFETYKTDPGSDEKVQFDNPEIEISADKRMFTWTIRKAKKGEMYFVKWLW